VSARERLIELDSSIDGLAIVTLRGQHDLHTAPDLREILLLAAAEQRAVVLELSVASFIDSTILGVIIGGLRRARESRCGFTLVVSPVSAGAVTRVLELTGLLTIFPNYETRAEAVAAAQAGVSEPVSGRVGHADPP
jgi:anti-sigma B factor antagonist